MTFRCGKRCTPVIATGAKTERGSRCMTACGSGQESNKDKSRVNSVASIDSQSVKSGGVLLGEASLSIPPSAMVSEAVGYDAGKQIKGRKRFISVDTLGKVAAGAGDSSKCARTAWGETSAQPGQTDRQLSIPSAYDLG